MWGKGLGKSLECSASVVLVLPRVSLGVCVIALDRVPVLPRAVGLVLVLPFGMCVLPRVLGWVAAVAGPPHVPKVP